MCSALYIVAMRSSSAIHKVTDRPLAQSFILAQAICHSFFFFFRFSLCAMRFTAAVAVAFVAFAPARVQSFNPTWGYVGGFEFSEWIRQFTDSDGWSLAGRPHEAMTKKGFLSKYEIYFDIAEGEMKPTMHRATEEVVQGSIDTDDHEGGKDEAYRVPGEAENSNAHCDDENISGCQKRLQDFQNDIKTLLEDGDVGRARNKLGRALHTLQDFYSHSNWVELGLGDSIGISQKLGVGSSDGTGDPGLELPVAPAGVQTCQNCSYPTPEIEEVQLDWISTCRSAVLGSDPMTPGNKFLVATCQGISTFGPKVANTVSSLLSLVFGPSVPAQLLGLAGDLAEALGHGKIYADCKNNLFPDAAAGGKYLTTGYFGVDLALGETWKAGKCSHGGPFDRAARGREGIGKDASHPFISPHSNLHSAAAKLAEEATKKYLDDVKDTICGDKLPIDCALLKTLYGVGPSLTFVIDTTGSMAGVIAAVRDAAIRIVNNVRDSETDRPSLYVLAPFNDPGVEPAAAYTNPDDFISAISGLGAFGGGDCPELAMGGLATAISATPAGGKIFLWTDAGAKDEANAAAVAQAAKAKNIAIMVFKFANSCNTPAAYDLVAPGRFFDELPGSEAASTASFAETLIVDDSVDLTSAIYGPSTSSPLRRRQSRLLTLDVPVDDTVFSVGFSVNTSTVTMTLTKPDGSSAVPGDPGVSIVGLATGNTIMVDAPAPGTWKVTLQGDEAFSFNSFAKTNLLLPVFNFVEPRGTHHEGLFPVLSPPAPGSTAFVVANIAGGVSSASFEFRSPGGALLSYLELSRGNGTDGLTPPDDTFHGLVTIPETAYFIYARGDTSSGKKFVRVVPGNLDLPFGDSGNITLPGASSSVPPSSSSMPPSSESIFPNSTAPASSGYFGNSSYTSATPTSTLCSTCQPEPCATAITSLTRYVPYCSHSWFKLANSSVCRTVIYLTTCPVVGAGGTTSHTTSSITTELPVPCFAKDVKDCPASLPVISPGCGSLPAPALGGGPGRERPAPKTKTSGVSAATTTAAHGSSGGGGSGSGGSDSDGGGSGGSGDIWGEPRPQGGKPDAYPPPSIPDAGVSATAPVAGRPTSSIVTAAASGRMISTVTAMVFVAFAISLMA